MRKYIQKNKGIIYMKANRQCHSGLVETLSTLMHQVPGSILVRGK